MDTDPKHTPGEAWPVQNVLGRAFQTASRLRIGGAVMLWTTALLYARFDPVAWKVALPATYGAAMGLMVVRDTRRVPHRALRPPEVAWVMGTIIVGFCILVLLSGGIRSPFLLIAPVMSMAIVIGTGQPRLFLPPVLLLLALVWTLALGDVWGPLAGLASSVFGAGTTASPTLSLALAVFVTAAIIMPAALGLRIRRALERAVAEAIRARAEHVATLQAHNAELMDLSRTVAHELKNPLASIQGLAGLLARRQVAGSREAERAGVLIDETRRLAGLLDEFLNFGRPAQGLAVRPVEARELFAAIADIFEATLRPLELRLEIDLQTIVPLRCDPRKLQQVLFNLIDNAVSVSPRGGHIVLRVEDMKPDSDDKHDSHIGHIGHMITVLDEGPGLPPAVRERLFQVGTTTRAGGSGLGLAIARQIARQHGGDLHVDDRPEGGCIARVHLPRMIPSADDRAGAET